MTLKQKHIIVGAGCYLLVLVVLALSEYWSNTYESLWILVACLPIEIGLLIVLPLFSKNKTEKAELKPDFVPSEEPDLTIGNHLTRQDYLWSVLLFVVEDVALGLFMCFTFSTTLTSILLAVVGLIFFLWMLKSVARSTYTLRADRLIVKEYFLGKQTTNLDIPISLIENMRYQYLFAIYLQQRLLIEVNGKQLELRTHGCAEQLAQEILARQQRFSSH